MNLKKILIFILGFILSGGLFAISIYMTDLINDRLALYIGVGIISILGIIVERKKIKPLTLGFLIGFIPVAIIIAGFIVISSLH